jgi:hypothetical protein
MKKFLALFLAVLILMPNAVFAEEVSAISEEESDVVVISFDDALNMILDDMLALQDLELVIRDLQIYHRDVQDIVVRLGTGEFQSEIIGELSDALREINHSLPSSSDSGAGLDMSLMMTDPGAFGTAMADMMSGLGITMGMSMVAEMSRAPINAQLANWRDTEYVEEFTENTQRSFNELDRQLQSLRLNQQVAAISMESALRGILIGIEEYKIGIDAMEANLALAETNVRRMTVAHEVGIISAHELRTMQHGLAQGHVQLEELRRGLASLRQNLNNLLGVPLTQNTVIEYERVIPEIPEDLDAHIAQLIQAAPSIRQLQFDIDYARAQRRANTGNDENIRITAAMRTRAHGPNSDSEDEDTIELRERIALQEAVERAVTAREQAMRAMDSAIRQAYSDFNALILQEAAQIRTLEQAEAALAAAEANFAAGRITAFDVEQARLAVSVAEQGIESILNRMWTLAFSLENPSLL